MFVKRWHQLRKNECLEVVRPSISKLESQKCEPRPTHISWPISISNPAPIEAVAPLLSISIFIHRRKKIVSFLPSKHDTIFKD